MPNFHGKFLSKQCYKPVCCLEEVSFTHQPCIRDVGRTKRASVHVSMLGEQDSNNRVELELRGRE